jgi:hypothetical protein
MLRAAPEPVAASSGRLVVGISLGSCRARVRSWNNPRMSFALRAHGKFNEDAGAHVSRAPGL